MAAATADSESPGFAVASAARAFLRSVRTAPLTLRLRSVRRMRWRVRFSAGGVVCGCGLADPLELRARGDDGVRWGGLGRGKSARAGGEYGGRPAFRQHGPAIFPGDVALLDKLL